MSNIDARWLTQPEAQHGEYGILLGGPRRPSVKPEPTAAPEDKHRHSRLWAWVESLPRIEMPAQVFSGYVLGFEEEGVKLGSIHVRFATSSEAGTQKVMALAKNTLNQRAWPELPPGMSDPGLRAAGDDGGVRQSMQ